MTRMWTGESDPVDAVDGVNLFDQGGEVAGRIVWCRIVVDDLSQELHLAPAGIGCFAHFGEDAARL